MNTDEQNRALRADAYEQARTEIRTSINAALASPKAKGKQTVMARATNKIGQTQTSELIHNPAGYHHNVIHSVVFNVA